MRLVRNSASQPLGLVSTNGAGTCRRRRSRACRACPHRSSTASNKAARASRDPGRRRAGRRRRRRASAGRRCRAVDGVGVDVDDGGAHAVGGEVLDDRLAETARSAGDHGDGAGEPGRAPRTSPAGGSGLAQVRRAERFEEVDGLGRSPSMRAGDGDPVHTGLLRSRRRPRGAGRGRRAGEPISPL